MYNGEASDVCYACVCAHFDTCKNEHHVYVPLCVCMCECVGLMSFQDSPVRVCVGHGAKSVSHCVPVATN